MPFSEHPDLAVRGAREVTLLDIGNSHTRVAVWRDGVIKHLSDLPSAGLTCEALPSGVPAVAACVVPELRRRLESAGRCIAFIDSGRCGRTVDFSHGDYSTLGADRVANAVALAAGYELPGAVVDCGTAVTLEVVAGGGIFAGGAIMPGRTLMSRALYSGTGALPETPLDASPLRTPGCCTVDALRFGIGSGVFGAVREWLACVEKQYGLKTVLLAGGDAGFLREVHPLARLAPADFTLQGIALAAGLEVIQT